jgi:hypothetical protein
MKPLKNIEVKQREGGELITRTPVYKTQYVPKLHSTKTVNLYVQTEPYLIILEPSTSLGNHSSTRYYQPYVHTANTVRIQQNNVPTM